MQKKSCPAGYLQYKGKCVPVRVGKPRKNEWDEWEVPVFRPDGSKDDSKTYYTDDKIDAYDTYRLMLRDEETARRR